jgi:large conductance mechanosensitive channel
MGIFTEFRAFVMRGNVIDFAVAVVIGAAFGAVVASFVENLMTPLIAAIAGEPDFSNLAFTINGSLFMYGAFINALLSFLLIAVAVFFFVVKPLNVAAARREAQVSADPTTRECPHCLSVIPIMAAYCAHCTREVGAGTLASQSAD